MDKINGKLDIAEEKINELEDRQLETFQSEEQKETNERCDDSLRDLWDTINQTNSWLIYALRESQKKR